MSDTPTISVVIPTYRRPNKLLRAINSVIEQTYSDWEIIVVNDDPETDIQKILPKDKKIGYINHSKNKGAPIARNDGISRSIGQYIALLDDDDAWKPSKLEKQINRFKDLDKDYGLVYTGRDIVHDKEVVETYIPEYEGDLHDHLLHDNIIPSETPLIRREVFDDIGLFDPQFKSLQDLDLWIRISRKYKIAAVPESLAVSYEGHDDRISSDDERKYQGIKRLLRKHRALYTQNPPTLIKLYRQLGLFAIRSNHDLEGATYLYSSFCCNPRDRAALLYLLLSISPDPLKSRLFNIRDLLVNKL